MVIVFVFLLITGFKGEVLAEIAGSAGTPPFISNLAFQNTSGTDWKRTQ